MANVMIIDDEQHCIDSVQELLLPYKKQYAIVATATTVDGAFTAANKHNPDLVFLDVQIGDKTGFDYLEKFGTITFDVIFTTAFDHYAVKAFKFSALDYLLKPIDPTDFDRTLKKFEAKSVHFMHQKINVLLHNLKNQNSVKKITVPTTEGYNFLDVDEILRCEADKNYTHIHLKNGKKITVSKTLKSFENLLEEDCFFRVHNSHLINLKEVKKYIKGKGGYVVMTNNCSIEVSTRRKEQFLKELSW